MLFLKKLHPVFQFLIIGFLFAAYLWIAIHFHVGFGPALLLLIVCSAFGASITTHEENTLQYNLEDVEQDTLQAITAKLSLFERKVFAKVLALAAKARSDV